MHAIKVASDIEAAARVMSETAHDLRSPLTSVREAIRLVHEGDLGILSSDQQSCLSAAIDQCNCMDQMIGEMVQLERLRTGSPRAVRDWIEVNAVRSGVDQSLRSWADPRGIDVLWDIADDSADVVFADASLLRRLIVNLATNAIRASRQGESVLIRLAKSRGGEMIQWSVIDQGSGINEGDMLQIADRRVSFAGGEGLGLSISRQLAAVHFSTLRIRSRLGYGTEVSFETPTQGPRAVASAWSRWRVAMRGPLHKPTAIQSNRHDRESPMAETKRVRLDPPSVSIELTHESTQPRSEDRLAAGVVSVGAAVSRSAADDFDRLLQSQLQMFELAYRTEMRSWIWVFDSETHAADARIALISDIANAKIGGIRLAWSAYQSIPIDHRRTLARLSDLMVRESLTASTSSRIVEQDEVRLGSAPIVHSEAAAVRLDAELRRLSEQMRSQTMRLRQQAKNLRPQL